MKTKLSAAAAILAVLLFVPLMSGCGLLTDALVAHLGSSTADILVSGELNAVYKGEFSEEYLERTGYTEEELTEIRQEFLAYEADFLAAYWEITDEYVMFSDLSPALQDALVELCDAMYRATKYSFEAAVAQKNGTYTVQATIEPVDLVHQIGQAWEAGDYAPLDDFFEKYTQEAILAMDDIEYIAYCEEYGWIIVNWFNALLPNLGYMDAKTQIIQIESSEDGLVINQDDAGIFNSYIIYYP